MLAAEFVQSGPARGVATFSRPLSVQDLGRLRGLGLQILQVEAVSVETSLHDGHRWTVFAPYGPVLADQLAVHFEEVDADMLGIVSATVERP